MGLAGAVALTRLPTARVAAPVIDQSLLLRRVAIVDPGTFGRPVEAVSILLPKDWQDEAGVIWSGDIGCQRNGIRLSLKAHSPDGMLGFEVFPDYVRNRIDDPQARAYTNPMAAFGIKGCYSLPPYDAAGYRQNLFLPRWRPGAALAAIETPRAGGSDEEWVLASLVRTVAYLPMLSGMGSFGSQMSGNLTTAALSQCAARAPKGQHEQHEKLFEAIYRSFRLNPVWEPAVAQHFRPWTGSISRTCRTGSASCSSRSRKSAP